MIGAGPVRVALAASDAQGHCGHDDALSAQPAHRLLQPAPRILPHVNHQAGVGRHLCVPRAPGPELVVTKVSCSPAAEMPRTIPAGTQPFVSSLAKSGP